MITHCDCLGTDAEDAHFIPCTEQRSHGRLSNLAASNIWIYVKVS